MKDVIQQCSIETAGPMVNLNFKFTQPMTPSSDIHTNEAQLWAAQNLITRMQTQGVLKAKNFHIVIDKALTLTEFDVQSKTIAAPKEVADGVKADFGLKVPFGADIPAVYLRSSEGLKLRLIDTTQSPEKTVEAVKGFLATQAIPVKFDTPKPRL